jgi:ubiquinone/menaquinone biosynthesis C-methylase UbiE
MKNHDSHVCATDSRKNEEATFHDNRERDRKLLSAAEFDQKYPNLRFYTIVQQSIDYLERWLQTHCRDAVVLDYCCGDGHVAMRASKFSRRVVGIDISSESIAIASTRAIKANCTNVEFMVGDAEQTGFPANTFDVIVCSGVLHHLDLSHAYPELERILKPNGRIICIEAFDHNPLIRWYRRSTPTLRTKWEVDHIIKRSDILLAKEYFGTVSVRYFHLFAIAAVPFRNTPVFNALLWVLNKIDSVVLRIPVVQLLAWQVIFELRKTVVTRRK